MLSFALFALAMVAVLGWGVQIGWSVLGLALWVILGMSYYFLVAIHNPVLSPEEQFAMFMVYSLKFSQVFFVYRFNFSCSVELFVVFL